MIFKTSGLLFRTFVIEFFFVAIYSYFWEKIHIMFSGDYNSNVFFFFVENLLSFEYLPVLLKNGGQLSYGKIPRIWLSLSPKNSFKFNQNRIKPTKSYINLLIKQSYSKITYLEDESFEKAFEYQ